MLLLSPTFSRGSPNKHGFHLMQTMRFTVEEINNGTGPQSLLPGVKLGYQMYDVCSQSAGVLATLDVLTHQNQDPFTPGIEGDDENSDVVMAVIGPDSSSNTLTPATLLGAYLIPEVSSQLKKYDPCICMHKAENISSHSLCSTVDLL